MRIVITSIPHGHQRYPTVGDWFRDIQGDLHIRVSKMANPKHELLIAIHELCEALCCESNHVDQLAVDKFDQTFAGEGEPGDAENCPYYHEHQVASGIERIMAAELQVDWNEYDAECQAL